MTTKTEDRAEDQAEAQYSSIVRMLAAVSCDYDRLEELRSEREELINVIKEDDEAGRLGQLHQMNGNERAHAELAVFKWDEENAEELAELEDAAGECRDEDDAREVIQQDPLEVQVRSDWTNPGDPLEASEFMILLCTGGPAVRIVGELNRGEPCRAWLEYQDWGTGWTQWFGARSETLCEYASNFFFGE
jgi:hypothetical protein